MLTDMFLLIPWCAAIGTALLTAPLGCFVSWQRLIYMGDGIAHAALLGVVLALLLQVAPLAGIVALALLMALLLAWMQRDQTLPADHVLAMLSHGALALGLVILSQSPQISANVNGLLFGDVLAASAHDSALIFAMASLCWCILWRFRHPMMRYVLHPDIAAVEGVAVHRMRLLLLVMIAFAVALSLQLVGMLLISALLILPASTARMLAHTPHGMIGWASLISLTAVTGGFAVSLHYDTPTGPTIILVCVLLFGLTSAIRRVL